MKIFIAKKMKILATSFFSALFHNKQQQAAPAAAFSAAVRCGVSPPERREDDE
jgi:hypothetical protein